MTYGKDSNSRHTDLLIDQGVWCAWCDTEIKPNEPTVPATDGSSKERLHLHCSIEEADGQAIEHEFDDW